MGRKVDPCKSLCAPMMKLRQALGTGSLRRHAEAGALGRGLKRPRPGGGGVRAVLGSVTGRRNVRNRVALFNT